MEIDKVLYNVELKQQHAERQQYISSVPQECLKQIHTEMIDRVIRFDPDDKQIIEQIRSSLKLYEHLMRNERFKKMSLSDESFICSLAFYLSGQKDAQYLSLALQLVQHQYITLEQKAYCQSINLFKSLSQIYQSVGQQYYQRLTHLMLKMVISNQQLLSVINHKYYFLQVLLQVVNKEKNTNKLSQLFSHLRRLYSVKKILLFHEIDLKILVDILLRTTINQHDRQLIQQTVKLYLVLSQNSILSQDKYRVNQFMQALKDKLIYMDQSLLGKNLIQLIHEILNIE